MFCPCLYQIWWWVEWRRDTITFSCNLLKGHYINIWTFIYCIYVILLYASKNWFVEFVTVHQNEWFFLLCFHFFQEVTEHLFCLNPNIIQYTYNPSNARLTVLSSHNKVWINILGNIVTLILQSTAIGWLNIFFISLHRIMDVCTVSHHSSSTTTTTTTN